MIDNFDPLRVLVKALIGTQSSSGNANTAASLMTGCRYNAASISPSSIRYPRFLIMRSRRPRNLKFPSGSSTTMSPVRYHCLSRPGRNALAVFSGKSQYPPNTLDPEMHNSPSVPRETSEPDSSTRRGSQYGHVLPIGTGSV